jgi:hypothetical protein
VPAALNVDVPDPSFGIGNDAVGFEVFGHLDWKSMTMQKTHVSGLLVRI